MIKNGAGRPREGGLFISAGKTLLLSIMLSAVFLPVPGASARTVCILDPGREYMEAVTEESWRIEHWRNHLRSRGMETRITTPGRLERDLSGCRLLVLPDVRELTDSQTAAVINFLERGNSLILTGRSGEKNLRAGATSLAYELGLRYARLPLAEEIRPEPPPPSPYGAPEAAAGAAPGIIINTPGFLSSGILPGQIVFTAEAPGYTTLRDAPGDAAGYWYLAGDDRDLEYWFNYPAIISSIYGNGKFIWMGPTIDTPGGDVGTVGAIAKLIDNAMDWFGGRPVVEKNPWKGFYEKSIVFAQDTEAGFANTLELFNLKDLPPTTFFILTDMAEINMNIFRGIAENPAAEIAVHGDSHDVFRGQPIEKQKERFRRILDFIKAAGRTDVSGFRPPEEQYDYYTLRAMTETGFEYIFSDDWPTAAAPKILNIEGKPLVQFPLLNKDDIKIIVEPRLYDNSLILQEYITDIDNIFSLGGLYMFNFHSHVLTADRHIEVIRDIINYIRPLNVWQASCAEIARWWKMRDSVDFRVARKSADFIEIEVLNNDRENIAEGISFTVRFPDGVRSARAETPPGERLPAGFRFLGDRTVTVIPPLEPLETFRFRVIWER